MSEKKDPKKRRLIIKIGMLLFHPFKAIWYSKIEFFVWFLFTIIAGQFGILANIIVKYYAKDFTIADSIAIDSFSGSFYTFSIAAVASILGPIFINFLNAKKIEFKTVKTLTIIFSIFFLFIAGIIYASIQSKRISHIKEDVSFAVDWSQLSVYIISIIIVSYGYSVLKLEVNSDKHKDINDPLFNEEDDIKVNETIEKRKQITEDINGIEL